MRTGGISALAVLTLGFGLTSLYLFWQLEAERSRTREVLEREAVCAPPAPPPTAAVEQLPKLSSQLALPVQPAATSVNAALSGGPRTWQPPEQTEEQRNYWTRKRYRAVFRELALSDDDIAALVPLLNEQDQRASKPIPKAQLRPDGSVPGADRTGDQAEIAALIGPQRAAQFDGLRKTMPARAQLQILRARLDDTDEPLSAEQQKLLLSVMNSRSYEVGPRRVEGELFAESMQRNRAWQEKLEQRTHDDAAAVLTPSQLKMVDEDAAMMKSMMVNMERGVALPGQGSAGAAAPTR